MVDNNNRTVWNNSNIFARYQIMQHVQRNLSLILPWQ